MNHQGKPSWQKVSQFQFVGTQAQGRLIIGYGAAEQIGACAASIAKGTALIIADPVVVQLGMEKRLCESLAKAGFSCEVYSAIQPEPHLADTTELITKCRGQNYDLVVGVGGGSAMDTAKLAALAAVTDEPIENYFHTPAKIKGSLPTILLPTTSGTGSEVSPYIVMSDEKGKKIFIGTGDLYATIAIVDPEFTVTMPPKVTAATGLDALTHGIEGMTGATSPYTLAVGTQCAELVFRYLPRAVRDGSDREARYYMAFASVLGMMAYTAGGGLYAHSMSYILTADKGLPHGAGCGLALPYTMAFNGEAAGEVNAALQKTLDTQNVPEKILGLVREVGLNATLADLGYEQADVPSMAKTLIQEYYRVKNPRSCTVEEAEKMLENMLLGKLDF